VAADAEAADNAAAVAGDKENLERVIARIIRRSGRRARQRRSANVILSMALNRATARRSAQTLRSVPLPVDLPPVEATPSSFVASFSSEDGGNDQRCAARGGVWRGGLE